MTPAPIHFNCVSCGACCKGRHGYVSLTLAETAAWLRRGHRVAVLLEAFPADGEQAGVEGLQPPLGYSVAVRSGALEIRVAPVFAGDVMGGCPNLAEDNACRIYADRPSVCRIYPAETNARSVFRIETKACPPESWTPSGAEVIVDAQGRTPPAIRALVDGYQRQLGDDVRTKVAICEALGIHLAAWRGNGVVIHNPAVRDFSEAIERVQSRADKEPAASWMLRVTGTELAAELFDANAQLFTGAGADEHLFIPMTAG